MHDTSHQCRISNRASRGCSGPLCISYICIYVSPSILIGLFVCMLLCLPLCINKYLMSCDVRCVTQYTAQTTEDRRQLSFLVLHQHRQQTSTHRISDCTQHFCPQYVSSVCTTGRHQTINNTPHSVRSFALFGKLQPTLQLGVYVLTLTGKQEDIQVGRPTLQFFRCVTNRVDKE